MKRYQQRILLENQRNRLHRNRKHNNQVPHHINADYNNHAKTNQVLYFWIRHKVGVQEHMDESDFNAYFVEDFNLVVKLSGSGIVRSLIYDD